MKYWLTYPDFFRPFDPPLPAISLRGTIDIFIFLPKGKMESYNLSPLKECQEYNYLSKKYPLLRNSIPFVCLDKKYFTSITEEEFFVELVKLRLK